MKTSKYQPIIRQLLKKPVFNAREAREWGIPSRMLAHFCRKGIIERVSRGVYKGMSELSGISPDYEGLVSTVLTVPQGVICLISALCFYGLTDQIMRDYWIAIPNKQRSLKRPHTRMIRMRNMTLGLTTIKIGKLKVKIFDRERTVVDAFRYLSDEIAIKALSAYLKSSSKHRPDLQKLSKYARVLRLNIDKFILALTT